MSEISLLRYLLQWWLSWSHTPKVIYKQCSEWARDGDQDRCLLTMNAHYCSPLCLTPWFSVSKNKGIWNTGRVWDSPFSPSAMQKPCLLSQCNSTNTWKFSMCKTENDVVTFGLRVGISFLAPTFFLCDKLIFTMSFPGTSELKDICHWV